MNQNNVANLACLAAAIAALLLTAIWAASALAAAPSDVDIVFPPALDSYDDAELTSIAEILVHRIEQEPFNLFATLIFLFAIVHTFMASKLMAMSHTREHAHLEKIKRGEAREGTRDLLAGAYHFLGEVEVVFGLWVIPLFFGIILFFDWSTVLHYIDDGVNLTEAAFVVVIMVLASTRPILQLGELIMMRIAGLFGGTLGAFWVTVMTIGPLLGSFITEPAAMTITALLLSQKFYDLGTSARFRYATLGLLFVNVSVGGTLTHFAAPPVLMVAGPWGWGTDFMLLNFGWKAVLGILIANGLYFLAFRQELAAMQGAYALELLKDRIARDFVPRQLMEEEWTRSVEEVEQRQRFIETIRARTDEYARAIRQSVEPVILSKAESAGADPELVKEAIEARFAEVVRYKLRRFMPALLPEAERPDFQDPDWDQRQDPVPVWVTSVHLLHGLDHHQCPPCRAVRARLVVLPRLRAGDGLLPEPDHLAVSAPGGLFPGWPRHPRWPAGLVDRTRFGQPVGNAAHARCDGAHRVQRQCGHHLSEHAGPRILREHEIRRGRRCRLWRRADGHRERAQSGGPINPQEALRRCRIAPRPAHGSAAADDHRLAVLRAAVTPRLRSSVPNVDRSR